MTTVTLYTRKRCHLCEVAAEVIDDVREELDFALEVFDIDADPALRAKYDQDVPVVAVAGEVKFKYRLTAEALRAAVEEAMRA
jgi:glutaredoxin